jgi:hypothetical protein
LCRGDRVRVHRWCPGPISSDEGDDVDEDNGDDDGAGATSARTAGERARCEEKDHDPHHRMIGGE